MNVKELIKQLEKIKNKEREILVSSDPEGNCFRKLYEVDDCHVYKEHDYEIEIGEPKLTKSLKDCGYTEEDMMKDGNPCIILWP